MRWGHRSRSLVLGAIGFLAFDGLGTNTIEAQVPEIQGFRTTVKENKVVLQPIQVNGVRDIKVPRLFNGVKSIRIVEGDQRWEGTLQPEIDHWKIGLGAKKTLTDQSSIELEMEGVPQWVQPTVTAQADGSFRLPGSAAQTIGARLLRYEPQPHKNTVGYWADAADSAWWLLQCDKAGEFNVAVLQGCGVGQGGSDVEFRFLKKVGEEWKPAGANVVWKIEETEHFQDFRWRHLGRVSLENGTYRIEVHCIHKAKNDVGDIRELQLVRLPMQR